MILTWEITALLLFELSPACSVYAMPSYIPSIKWECCYPTIWCAGDKFQGSLLQEHPKGDVAFREDTTCFYVIGEQNSWEYPGRGMEQNAEKRGKGGTKWEDELNISAEHPKSGILTSSHGAILWIMSFRWPIIRSSWKSYGNVSVHSVSNCKILGPNFLIRAWNANHFCKMMDREWNIYSLKSLTVCVSECGARFSKKAFVLHLQNLHTCIQRV